VKTKRYENSPYLINSDGTVFHEDRNEFIKPFPGGTGGYLMVNIWHNSKNRLVAVHRLVAEAFLPNPKGLKTVNHINGIRTDNSVKNLEWASYSENLLHATRTGLAPTGSNKVNAKLNDDKVKEIIGLIKSGEAISKVAEKFRVSTGTISEICKGNTWKHITGGVPTPYQKAQRMSKLSPADIPVIRKMFEDGKTDAEIAAIYRVARGTINQIRQGKTWKNY
jgi:hypothetical protein